MKEAAQRDAMEKFKRTERGLVYAARDHFVDSKAKVRLWPVTVACGRNGGQGGTARPFGRHQVEEEGRRTNEVHEGQ